MKYLATVTTRMSSVVTHKLLLWTALLALLPNICLALTFPLPKDSNIVGTVKYATVRSGESLWMIGRRFDVGGYEMLEANPGENYVNPRVGKTILVPSQFVLPSGSRKGIVINLAELRLYYYHPDGQQVSTFPVGVGQEGWDTPLGETTVVRKRENPTWVVPESILENHRRHGQPIEPTMPPGPKNPLGEFAMNTGFKNIVIHGTPYPRGVGLRSSHGCIRMLPEDIRALYQMVPVGTSVRVVHEPNKIGYSGNKVYMESHVPISDTIYAGVYSTDTLIQNAANAIGRKLDIQMSEARKSRNQTVGYPIPIGTIQ